jgi:hypothetical protein
MQNENILQFVGYITQLNSEEFLLQWEGFVKGIKMGDSSVVLQQGNETKGKYKFLSIHNCRKDEFNFDFMKSRKSRAFPEQKVKVMQTGGYINIGPSLKNISEESELRILAFLPPSFTNLDFFNQVPFKQCMRKYQAYYESCTYGHILEFFINEAELPVFMPQLIAGPTIDTAVYRNCFELHY